MNSIIEFEKINNSLRGGLWRTRGSNHFAAIQDPVTKVLQHVRITDLERSLASLPQDKHQYLACSEFATPKRTSDSALGAYGFWMDTDCGLDKSLAGKGYADQAEAHDAFEEFAAAAGLPPSTHRVDSGGGLHFYWMLQTFVPKQRWLEAARSLKVLTEHFGFRADPSRTADIASLMRLPGSLNHKYSPPRPVQVVHATAPIEANVFLGALDTSAARHLKATAVATAGAVAPSVCRQRRHADTPTTLLELASLLVQIPPDVGYDEWRTALMAVHTETGGSEEGLELVIEWSSGGAKFKGEQDLRQKWRSFRLNVSRPVTIGSLIWLAKQYGGHRHAA